MSNDGRDRPVTLPAWALEGMMETAYADKGVDPHELGLEWLDELVACQRALKGLGPKTVYRRELLYSTYAAWSDTTLLEYRDLLYRLVEELDEGPGDPAWEAWAALDILVSTRVCDEERDEITTRVVTLPVSVRDGMLIVPGDNGMLPLGLAVASNFFGCYPDDVLEGEDNLPEGAERTLTFTITSTDHYLEET